MEVSEVIINEQALDNASKAIKKYIESFQELVSSAIRQINSLGGDWDDDDYNNLVSAINAFQADVESMSNGANQLITRINSKISQIKQLHSMKI